MIRKVFIGIIFLTSGLLFGQNLNTCSCCTSLHRQFDFWLGDWETLANGKIAGINRIVTLQDGCVIQENWTSSGGKYTGTSYNFYDSQEERWHQVWIDNQGQILKLTGGIEGKSMVLMSTPVNNQAGEKVIHRITWTPNTNGTVRQHWESQKVASGDWQTLFDGLYRKKGPEN